MQTKHDHVLIRLIRSGTSFLLPVGVLLLAVILFMVMMKSAPRAERTPRPQLARLVETVSVSYGEQQVSISALGTVQAAQHVILRPQVDGEVVEISQQLVPGGYFQAGKRLLRIDASDYRLAVKQRESDLARARAELAMEQGNQAIARRENEILGEVLTDQESGLVLRKPQLAMARASVTAAQAALDNAHLALSRTIIMAPFDALVMSESVDLGTRLTSQSEIATLVGTDVYWVELSVPGGQLKWIRLPGVDEGMGAAAKLYQDAVWGPGEYRGGHVIRLLGEVGDAGRMARVLVAVEDPLAILVQNAGAPRLLIGAYLRAEIVGRTLPAAVALNREWLRDGNRVWIMNEDDQLEIRALEIAYRGSEEVFVTGGLADGERIVTSGIAAVAAGMPLRVDSGGNINSPETEPTATRERGE